MTEGPPAPVAEADDFQLIDFDQVRERLGFVLHSVQRRKKLAVATFLGCALISLGVLQLLPRTFHVETQLLAQKNLIMPSLGNPGRTVPTDADAPTRAASETVLRRDNLVSLMRQTELMKQWDATRLPHLRVKDAVVRMFFGAPTDDERTTAVLEYLEKKLKVTTGENTVTIGIDWPNPQMAYRLVDAAQQNFLEQRHGVEVSAIAETITILEGHAASLKDAIDVAMEDLTRDRAPKPGRPLGTPAPRRDPAELAARAEAAEVKVMLQTKRRAIGELEEFRRRRLGELQAELSAARAVYADAHPAVAKVLASVAALEQDSPQLASLREEERELSADYDRVIRARPSAALPLTPTTPSAALEAAPRYRAGLPSVDDPTGEMNRAKLRFAMAKYDSVLERIDSARIELDTARAAFKYRYSTIRPPTLPKRPEKPNVPLVVALGFLGSLACAFAVTSLADLRSGRVVETWQVERYLGLEVLGELPRTKAAA